MKVEYISHMGDDLMVVNAARVSFGKHKTEMDDKDDRLIEYLARNGHWTPFSHPTISVRVTVPIFVARQLFKHKVGMTENEISRRYVDDEPEFFFPEKWRGRPTEGAKQGSSDTLSASSINRADIFYHDALATAELAYKVMIDEGVAPEQARMVLPQSMYTSWYWTGSLAAFARIYGLRSDPHAQKETQEIAHMIDDIIRPLFPRSWEALCGEKIEA